MCPTLACWNINSSEAWHRHIAGNNSNRLHRCIDVDIQIGKYETDVGQFQHSVAALTKHLAPTSLFFVIADAYNQSFCAFFGVTSLNSFFITEPEEDNIIQQLF